MTPELKKAWIEKLRSGTVVQCFGKYRQGDARCAAGVLIDLDPLNELQTTNVRATILLNDYTKMSFNEIADWIERNVDADA